MTRKDNKKSIEKSSDSSGSRKPSPSPAEYDLNLNDVQFLLSPELPDDGFQTPPAPVQGNDERLERALQENKELKMGFEMLNAKINQLMSTSKEPEQRHNPATTRYGSKTRESLGGGNLEYLRKPGESLGTDSGNTTIERPSQNVTKLVTDLKIKTHLTDPSLRSILEANRLRDELYSKQPELKGKISLAYFYNDETLRNISNAAGVFNMDTEKWDTVDVYELSDVVFENMVVDYVRPDSREQFVRNYLLAMTNFSTSEQFRSERTCSHGNGKFAELRLSDFSVNSKFMIWVYKWLDQAVKLVEMLKRSAWVSWIDSVLPDPGLGKFQNDGIIKITIAKLGIFSQSFINLCGGKRKLHDGMELPEFRSHVHKILVEMKTGYDSFKMLVERLRVKQSLEDLGRQTAAAQYRELTDAKDGSKSYPKSPAHLRLVDGDLFSPVGSERHQENVQEFGDNLVLREMYPTLYYAQNQAPRNQVQRSASQAPAAQTPCFRKARGLECRQPPCPFNHDDEVLARCNRDTVFETLSFTKYQSPLATLTEFFKKPENANLWSALKRKIDSRDNDSGRPFQPTPHIVTRRPDTTAGLQYIADRDTRHHVQYLHEVEELSEVLEVPDDHELNKLG